MSYQNLLQNRINELNSAILNFVGDKVYITGFYNDKMLLLHLDDRRDNHKSKGIYNKEDIDFNNVLNNALFVIQKDGVEQRRIQYKLIFKEAMEIKNPKEKSSNIQMVSIRKDIFSDTFLLHARNKVTSFENKDDLNSFILEQYKTNLQF